MLFYSGALAAVLCAVYQGCGGNDAKAPYMTLKEVKFGDQASMQAYFSSMDTRVEDEWKKKNPNLTMTIPPKTKVEVFNYMTEAAGAPIPGNVLKVATVTVESTLFSSLLPQAADRIASGLAALEPMSDTDCAPYALGVMTGSYKLEGVDITKRAADGSVVSGKTYAKGANRVNLMPLAAWEAFVNTKQGDVAQFVFVSLKLVEVPSATATPGIKVYNPDTKPVCVKHAFKMP